MRLIAYHDNFCKVRKDINTYLLGKEIVRVPAGLPMVPAIPPAITSKVLAAVPLGRNCFDSYPCIPQRQVSTQVHLLLEKIEV